MEAPEACIIKCCCNSSSWRGSSNNNDASSSSATIAKIVAINKIQPLKAATKRQEPNLFSFLPGCSGQVMSTSSPSSRYSPASASLLTLAPYLTLFLLLLLPLLTEEGMLYLTREFLVAVGPEEAVVEGVEERYRGVEVVVEEGEAKVGEGVGEEEGVEKLMAVAKGTPYPASERFFNEKILMFETILLKCKIFTTTNATNGWRSQIDPINKCSCCL